jgi:hypothetical protein
MSISPMHAALHCHAQSKRTGEPAPAVRGWQVCRMHGARGGAKLSARSPHEGNYASRAAHQENPALRPVATDCQITVKARRQEFETVLF